METIMDILDQFERRAIEAIKTDKQIDTTIMKVSAAIS